MDTFTSAATPRSTLPRPLTRFVGRGEELRTLAVLLADPACHLITITGPGGVGKTRLALEAAQMCKSNFAAGACFVNLQPLSDPGQLPTALADALGCPLSGADPIEQQLLRFLAHKEMLLLLDNFEHLSAGAGFLAGLLVHAPGVKILVAAQHPRTPSQHACGLPALLAAVARARAMEMTYAPLTDAPACAIIPHTCQCPMRPVDA
jgi:hypothetical protein